MDKIKQKKKDVVSYIASLAKLEPSPADAKVLKNQVEGTIEYISALSEIDTKGVPMTSQVTGLKNVFREDVVDEKRVLSQKEALSNAKKSYKGFFVVKGIFEE